MVTTSLVLDVEQLNREVFLLALQADDTAARECAITMTLVARGLVYFLRKNAG